MLRQTKKFILKR